MSRLIVKCKEFTKKEEYKNCLELLRGILYIFLFVKMTLNLCYVSESQFQTFRQYFFWKAIIYFLIAFAILIRVRLLNWPTLTFIFIYVTLASNWIMQYAGVTDLLNWYKAGAAGICIGGVILIDMIMYKKMVIIKQRQIIPTVVLVIAAVVTCVLQKGRNCTFVPFFPFMLLYLAKIDEQKWFQWIKYLLIGYYGAFVWIMLKSFLTVPYDGKRYYGIFINNGLFGIFAGGAFCCTLIYIWAKTRNGWKFKWDLVLAFAAMLFSLIAVDMISARVAELGVLVAVCTAYIFFPIRNDKKKKWRRGIIIVTSLLLIIAIGIGFLAWLNTFTEKELQSLITNEVICGKLEYWRRMAVTMFTTKSKHGVIPAGTLLNAIDRFSSGRLSYVVAYLQEMNWFGHEGLGLNTSFRFLMHPHNTFVAWLYLYGIVGGGIYILWYLYMIVESGRRGARGNLVYMTSFIWLMYTVTVMMNEVEQWIYQVGFVSLIMLYPLFIQFKNKDTQNTDSIETERNSK